MCADDGQPGRAVIRPTLGRQPVGGQLRAELPGGGVVTSPARVRGAEVLADQMAALIAASEWTGRILPGGALAALQWLTEKVAQAR